jgi:hypothetical protein
VETNLKIAFFERLEGNVKIYLEDGRRMKLAE